MARHVQYNVEVFFKGIILDVPLRKTKHCPARIEFQERSIPNFHWFVWILNLPNIQNEAVYVEFIEKAINTPLSDH